MKIRFLLLPLLLALSTFAQAENWSTDYKASLAEAKKHNKLVLLDFTGSDYCAGCILLAKNVYPTAEFQSFLVKNFVPVTVDFPNFIRLPNTVALQNNRLQDQFKVEAIPTLIVVSPDGREIGRLEAPALVPITSPALIEKLRKLIKK